MIKEHNNKSLFSRNRKAGNKELVTFLRNILQNNCCLCIQIEKMSDDTIQEDIHYENLRSLFETFDSDRDGKISSSGVVLALQNHHKSLSEDEIGYVMRFFDLDKDDVVDFGEFIKMAKLFESNRKMTNDIQIRQLFRAADKNKDGMLSPEELKELWSLVQSDENTKRLSENEMDDMIRSIDVNGDGKIDFKEFFDLLSSSLDSH